MHIQIHLHLLTVTSLMIRWFCFRHIRRSWFNDVLAMPRGKVLCQHHKHYCRRLPGWKLLSRRAVRVHPLSGGLEVPRQDWPTKCPMRPRLILNWQQDGMYRVSGWHGLPIYQLRPDGDLSTWHVFHRFTSRVHNMPTWEVLSQCQCSD